MTQIPGSRPEDWSTHTHVWADVVDLEHLAEIRERSADLSLEHLVMEVLAYADDEAKERGIPGTVTVTIDNEQVSVDDDGRGTETRRTADGVVVRKPVMSTRDVRFYGQDSAPTLPDGLPRRGMSTVAALTEALVHENHRLEGSWTQRYRFGVPDERLQEIPYRGHTGTVVTFSTSNTSRLNLASLAAPLARFPHLDASLIDARKPPTAPY
ncbi:MAG: hypothetical protein QM713_14325 [Arachnia sp.]